MQLKLAPKAPHPATQPDGRGLKVSECFVSIQGEGKLTGTPSYFIRVSGCNLRCTWCDTPYASWNPEGLVISLDQLAERARASGVRHVVLTGGEPLLFPQACELTPTLRASGFHITVETAGTIAWPSKDLACDLLSVSPKLANSTPQSDPRDPTGAWAKKHEERRLNMEALQRLLDEPWDRQLKFVVQSANDLREVESVLAELRGWRPEDVMLMPEGTTVPNSDAVRWILQVCIEKGFRYCPRLHIHLFGNTRGT